MKASSDEGFELRPRLPSDTSASPHPSLTKPRPALHKKGEGPVTLLSTTERTKIKSDGALPPEMCHTAPVRIVWGQQVKKKASRPGRRTLGASGAGLSPSGFLIFFLRELGMNGHSLSPSTGVVIVFASSVTFYFSSIF